MPSISHLVKTFAGVVVSIIVLKVIFSFVKPLNDAWQSLPSGTGPL